MARAIVLAGGTEGGENKAFLDGAGRPFIWHVARALRGTAQVERVVAVGPVERIREALGDLVDLAVPEAGTIMDNVTAALSAMGEEPRLGGPPGPPSRVLVAASDIPLLTADAVEEFLGACTKEEADFYYAIVPQTVLEDRYPGARKNFVRVLDGSFAGGNVMLVNAGVVDRVRPFVERVLQARKKPWLMASLFGWSTVMRLVSGKLSIKEMEERAREVTGVTARAVLLRRPEVALDADVGKPENLAIIQRELAARAEGSRR